MNKKDTNIIDIIGRSIAFVIINYILVSTELSFKASILGLLASLANIWIIIDYFKVIHTQTNNKILTIVLCGMCLLASIAVAYFVGYVKGTIMSF